MDDFTIRDPVSQAQYELIALRRRVAALEAEGRRRDRVLLVLRYALRDLANETVEFPATFRQSLAADLGEAEIGP